MKERRNRQYRVGSRCVRIESSRLSQSIWVKVWDRGGTDRDPIGVAVVDLESGRGGQTARMRQFEIAPYSTIPAREVRIVGIRFRKTPERTVANRGCGIGTVLLRHTIEVLQAGGCSSLSVRVLDEDLEARPYLGPWLQRLGFESSQVGERGHLQICLGR